MGKFNAGTAVEAMEYDFTDYGGGAGVIPEPSDEVLDAFYQNLALVMDEVQETVGDLQDLDISNIDAVQKALAATEGTSAIRKVSDSLTTLLADLTQGQPSAEDIARLPFRVKQAFMGWLVGQFNPEGGTPASKR